MTDKTPKDQKPAKSSKREYVVLEALPGAEGAKIGTPEASFMFLGKFNAASESSAKKLAINAGKTLSDKWYALVAIPARSWNPTTPKVTAQTVLKIEGV